MKTVYFENKSQNLIETAIGCGLFLFEKRVNFILVF